MANFKAPTLLELRKVRIYKFFSVIALTPKQRLSDTILEPSYLQDFGCALLPGQQIHDTNYLAQTQPGAERPARRPPRLGLEGMNEF